jgi:hypothetical protein
VDFPDYPHNLEIDSFKIAVRQKQSFFLMIFVCKLPISKIKGYCFRYCLYQDHYLGSPDNGPDKDGIENKMPFILYIIMYNIDFTEYDRTFSKNAVILEKCSFRDNVTIRLYYGMLNLLAKSII